MTTIVETDLRSGLDKSDLNVTADVLKLIGAGTTLSKVTATFTGLTSLAAQDVTSDDAKANAVVTGIDLGVDENLPAIGEVVSCRVTAGTAATGPRVITDAGGTPDATAGQLAVATLSADDKTLTFEAAVTAYVLVYYPATKVPLNTTLQSAAP